MVLVLAVAAFAAEPVVVGVGTSDRGFEVSSRVPMGKLEVGGVARSLLSKARPDVALALAPYDLYVGQEIELASADFQISGELGSLRRGGWSGGPRLFGGVGGRIVRDFEVTSASASHGRAAS